MKKTELNECVLIADDDRFELFYLKKILTDRENTALQNNNGNYMNFELHLFEDGAPLLAFFRKEFEDGRRIPLCILDIKMSGMGGIETAKAVRKIDPEVFILMITSISDVSYPALFDTLQKDVYFMKKPLHFLELQIHVTSLIINWNNLQELHRAYEKMHIDHYKLKMIIENTPIAVAVLDNQLRYLAYSRRWVMDLGIRERHIEGRFHYDMVTDIPSKWKKEHERCLAGETIKHEEEIFHRADGSVEYVKRDLYPLRDVKGKISGIIIFIKFITAEKLANIAKKQAENKIRENEAYLQAVMSAVQISIMIIDPYKYTIIDANPHTMEMLDRKKEDIVGKDFYDLLCDEPSGNTKTDRVVDNEYAIPTKKKGVLRLRRSIQETIINRKPYLVQSLLDITDIHSFMKEQEISIDLAKHLLKIINGPVSRYTELSNDLSLFFDVLYYPCHKEGGDHYFMRNLDDAQPVNEKRTVMSLKDQSGHEVGCILRSIITDLIHHSIINRQPDISLENIITILNRTIYDSGGFSPRDFFSSIDISLDHQTLKMSYVSSGHPCFFLIRGTQVVGLPEHGGSGKNLPIPVIRDLQYEEGVCRLKPGDKLLFYSDGLNDLSRLTGKKPFTSDMLKSSILERVSENPSVSVSDLMRLVVHSVSQKSGIDQPYAYDKNPDDISIIGIEIECTKYDDKTILKPCTTEQLDSMLSELTVRIMRELKNRKFHISEFCVRSILTESVFNAWRHGNRKDPAKSITVEWRFGNDFHLTILDQGDGFEYHRIFDTKTREDLLKTSGRGLFIIRKYSDAVEWTQGGRCISITLEKHPAPKNDVKYTLGKDLNKL